MNFERRERWLGTRGLPWGLLRQLPSVQFLRDAKTPVEIENGGWHFSYLGGEQKIREKIAAFSHQEFNRSEFTDCDAVARAMREGTDLFGRDLAKFEVVEMGKLPGYVIENRNRFRDLLWSDLENEVLSDEDCQLLEAAYRSSEGAAGEIVAISPGRGAIACALANVCHPAELSVIDSKEDQIFRKNVRSLTLGNVRWEDWKLADLLAQQGPTWRFCLIGRDATLNAAEIQAIADRLGMGGVLCGENRAHIATDLPGVQTSGKLWWWQKSGESLR